MSVEARLVGRDTYFVDTTPKTALQILQRAATIADKSALADVKMWFASASKALSPTPGSAAEAYLKNVKRLIDRAEDKVRAGDTAHALYYFGEILKAAQGPGAPVDLLTPSVHYQHVVKEGSGKNIREAQPGTWLTTVSKDDLTSPTPLGVKHINHHDVIRAGTLVGSGEDQIEITHITHKKNERGEGIGAAHAYGSEGNKLYDGDLVRFKFVREGVKSTFFATYGEIASGKDSAGHDFSELGVTVKDVEKANDNQPYLDSVEDLDPWKLIPPSSGLW